MFRHRFQNLTTPEDRSPLRVMFVHTEVVVGGAETLLLEIIRKMDRERFSVELCCLKQLAELGEVIAKEVPTHVGLLDNKFDYKVIGKLANLLRERRIDAVVTVGTGGDRMFWGRLGAWRAGVPVVLSALHSTGYPVYVEWMNRMLWPITDGFIGCASKHSEFLVSGEGCPRSRTFTVWNGVDVDRFCMRDQAAMRDRLQIAHDIPVAGIVAALRPEKQHTMLIEAWKKVVQAIPEALLVIVGDGIVRPDIEAKTKDMGLESNVRLLGTRHDVPEVLSAMDLKVLSSKMEANPASTLEANACGLPVVAPNVGSLPDTIKHGETGLLCEPNDPDALAQSIIEILSREDRGKALGQAAHELVRNRFSVEVMVGGYETLIDGIYRAAMAGRRLSPSDYDAAMERLIEKAAMKRANMIAPVAGIESVVIPTQLTDPA